MNWKGSPVRKSYDKIVVVWIPEEKVYGHLEKFGAYASVVSYYKDGEQYEDLLENSDFITVNEIVFEHIEEE